MKSVLVLVFMVLAAGFSAAGQEKKARKGKEEKGLIKVSIMYPAGEGKTFDMDYYETKHMPMVAGFLGDNLVKYTIERALASGIPNQPLPYVAIGTFYVKNLPDYQAAIAPNRDAIRADIANYTNIAPVILVSELVVAK